MCNSLLYDLLEAGCLGKYREKQENEYNSVLAKWVKTAREELEKAFNEQQLEMIDSYVFYVKSRIEDINILTDIKLLNYGVKIGMQLQQAFNEDKE